MRPVDYSERAVALVPCPLPECRARVGEPCYGVYGSVRYTHSVRRWDAALRARDNVWNMLIRLTHP